MSDAPRSIIPKNTGPSLTTYGPNRLIARAARDAAQLPTVLRFTLELTVLFRSMKLQISTTWISVSAVHRFHLPLGR